MIGEMDEKLREILNRFEEEARAEGEEIGEIRGESRGRIIGEVKGLIVAYREYQMSDEEIVAKLIDKYCLDEEVDVHKSEKYTRMCKGIRDMVLEAESEGGIEGRFRVKNVGEIIGTILVYIECWGYEELILARLKEKYDLNEDQARYYYEQARELQ